MLAVDHRIKRNYTKEAEHDKTFSKTMENGKYTYGENYKIKRIKHRKEIILRNIKTNYQTAPKILIDNFIKNSL